MLNVTYPSIETENSEKELIEFEAICGGQTIKCAVTYQALYDHFDAKYSDPLFSFMSERKKIEAIATQFITDRKRQDDGSILITSTNF
jgi:hypothetical protein